MKKICMITSEFPPMPGGVSLASKRIASDLAKEGYLIHVVTIKAGNESYYFNEEEDVVVEQIDGITVHKIGPSNNPTINSSAIMISTMYDYISRINKAENFDIFNGFSILPAGFLAVLLGKKFNKKSVVSIRGKDLSKDIFYDSFFEKIIWTLQNADHVTSVADDLIEFASTLCRIRKYTIIHNSINADQFFYKPELSVKGKGLIIGTSAIIRGAKGFIYLLQGFKRFIDNNEATLAIIGDFKEDEKDFFIKAVKSLGLSEHVYLTGKIEHKFILNYLKCLDIFVYPSIYEGCPNSLLEAMYCKIPPIVTPIGAMREIIKDGFNGLVVEQKNASEITVALNKLALNHRLRDKLGNEAYMTIKKYHRTEQEISKWKKVFDD